MICTQCGVVAAEYGYDFEHKPFCYPCCDARLRKQIDEGFDVALYVTDLKMPLRKAYDGEKYFRDCCTPLVKNWTGHVFFRARARAGNHNWRGVVRYDIWFNDHNKREWYGRLAVGSWGGEYCVFRMTYESRRLLMRAELKKLRDKWNHSSHSYSQRG